MSGFPKSQGLLEPIQSWLNDSLVSEILLNEPQIIYVEKEGILKRVSVPEYQENLLDMLFQLIANENQQEFNQTKPILSGNLLDGSRVQLVLPPTAQNYTMSIRRQVVKHFKLDDYPTSFYENAIVCKDLRYDFDSLDLSEKMLLRLYADRRWDEFIRNAILLKKNIIISGGTSSGKTTYLNACLRYIPIEERIITLEDTREIDIPHPNQVNLVAPKGEQGVAKINMQELVQCCLRLRPDRIILGEIRGKEILDFVSACSTGHDGSLTTIHASNPKIAFMRMTQMYKLNNVPSMRDEDILRELQEIVDIIIQVVKTEKGRRVSGIYYKHATLADKQVCKRL